MNRKVYLLLFFLFSVLAFSQQKFYVKGVVLNTKNHSLEAVAVKLKDSETGKLNSYSITNTKGEFEINDVGSGNYILEVLSLGYQDYSKPLSVNQNINIGAITLIEKSIELEEVTITSKKPLIKNTDEGIQLNIQGTALSKKQDIISILKYAPNMDGLEIAGSPDIKLLLNGKEVRIKPEQFEVFLKTIKPESVKTIEITDRVDASVEGNITGLLNIITKKNVGFSGNVGSRFLYNNFFGTINDAGFYFGKNNFRLFLELYQSDKINETHEDGKRSIDGDLTFTKDDVLKLKRQERDLIFGFDYEIDSTSSLGFLYNYTIDNDKDFTILSNQEITGSSVTVDSLLQIKKFFDHKSNTHTFSLQYDKALDTIGSNINISTDFASYSFKEPMLVESNFYANGILSNYSQTSQNDDVTSSILGITFDWKKKMTSGNSFSIGAKFSYNKNISDYTFFDNNDNDLVLNTDFSNKLLFNEFIYATYFNYRHNFKKTNFSVGVRFEYNLNKFGNNNLNTRRDNFNVLPTLYYNIPFNKKHRLYFYVSKRISRPSYYRYNPVVIQFTPVEASSGNPDLIPVDNYIFQFGYTYKRKYSLIGRYTYQEKTIVSNSQFDIQNGYTLTQPVNSGYNNTAFLLLSIPVNLFEWWEISNKASLRYTNFYTPIIIPKQHFESIYATFNSYHDIVFLKNISVSIDFSYNTPYRNLYYKYADFFTVNAGLSTPLFKEKFNLMVYFTDIFYTQRNITQYTFNEINNRNYSRFNSRGVFFGISYNFNNGKDVDEDVIDSNIEEEKSRITH